MQYSLTRCFALSTIAVAIFVAASPAQADPKKIGVTWFGQESMADRVYAGFEKRLKEVAPDFTIEVQKELKDLNAVDQVFRRYEIEKDAIVILRSGGSQYLSTRVEEQPKKPTFIGAGNHPIRLGAVKNMDAPEGNVTGVTYYVPIDKVIDSYLSIMPSLKSFLLLSQANYVSSAIDWDGTKTACEARGLRCAQQLVASREEAIAAATANKEKYDAVIVGNQSAAFDNADAVAVAMGQKPVFSYAEKGVLLGALGGLLANDEKLGKMLADALVDVVVRGKKISQTPVRVDPEPTVFINMKAMKRIGVEAPLDVLSSAVVIE